MVFKNLNRFTAFASFLVFCLPFQTRYLLPYLDGVVLQGDLTVFSVYALEILILLGVLVFGVQFQLEKRTVPWLLGGMGFILLSLLSALWSPVPVAATHFALHATSALMLFVLLSDARVDRKVVARAFILGLIVPVLFGVYQVAVGSFPSSLVLGIARRSAETLGDSVVFFGDARILRAYGTFPHPNIFGGMLAFGILLLAGFPVFEKRVRVFLGALLGIGLFLTFSQGAWIALAIGLVAHFARLNQRALGVFVALCLLASLSFMAIAPILTIGAPTSVAERIEQAKEGLQIMKRTPVIGTGAGNYLHESYRQNPGSPWYAYQPVHNAYLLLILELGIFILPFFLLVRNPTILRPSLLALIATIALFDHYLVTQWSGMVLFATALALLDSEC